MTAYTLEGCEVEWKKELVLQKSCLGKCLCTFKKNNNLDNHAFNCFAVALMLMTFLILLVDLKII